MISAYEAWQRTLWAKMSVEELAQKLFNEEGYPGNVYKARPELLQRFENLAIEILKGE